MVQVRFHCTQLLTVRHDIKIPELYMGPNSVEERAVNVCFTLTLELLRAQDLLKPKPTQA